MSEWWRFTRAEQTDDPALNYALDLAIAEHISQGQSPATVRLWQPGRCLAVGRFDNRLPHFGEVVQHIKSQGIEIIQRMSGGKAVWQDVGYLNFSIIAPKQSLEFGIAETYREFSQGLVLGFRALGVETEFKQVEGAFCDGPYDLAVHGSKLVGTAQVQKRGFVIVHGTILVDCDLDEMMERISEFYEHAGQPTHLRRETMTTVAAQLGWPLAMKDLMDALREGYQQTLGELTEEELLASEWERARELRGEVIL